MNIPSERYVGRIWLTSAGPPLSTPENTTGLEFRIMNPNPSFPLLIVTVRGGLHLFSAEKIGRGPSERNMSCTQTLEKSGGTALSVISDAVRSRTCGEHHMTVTWPITLCMWLTLYGWCNDCDPRHCISCFLFCFCSGTGLWQHLCRNTCGRLYIKFGIFHLEKIFTLSPPALMGKTFILWVFCPVLIIYCMGENLFR